MKLFLVACLSGVVLLAAAMPAYPPTSKKTVTTKGPRTTALPATAHSWTTSKSPTSPNSPKTDNSPGNSPDSPFSPRHNASVALPFSRALCCLERHHPDFINFTAVNASLYGRTFGNYTCNATSQCATDTEGFVHDLCEAAFPPHNDSSANTTCDGGDNNDNHPRFGRVLKCLLAAPRGQVNWTAVVDALPDLLHDHLRRWEEHADTVINRLLFLLQNLLLHDKNDKNDDDDSPHSPRHAKNCTLSTTTTAASTTTTAAPTTTTTTAAATTTTTAANVTTTVAATETTTTAANITTTAAATESTTTANITTTAAASTTVAVNVTTTAAVNATTGTTPATTL